MIWLARGCTARSLATRRGLLEEGALFLAVTMSFGVVVICTGMKRSVLAEDTA